MNFIDCWLTKKAQVMERKAYQVDLKVIH